MADSGYAELQDMRLKFRRYTGWLSSKTVSDVEVDKYLNNFGLNKLTEYISSTVFEKIFTFYTTANKDVYESSNVPGDALYNFKNIVRVIGAPVYVFGRPIELYESVAEFNSVNPQSLIEAQVGTGDAVTTNFTGTLDQIPVLKSSLYSTSIDTAGDALLATDNGAGEWEGSVSVAGSINYITGAYDITFDVAPETGEAVYINFQPYNSGHPRSVLFYDNKLTLRPVPDKAYKVEMITMQRPTKLVGATDLIPLTEFADFWVIGSCIDALQERGDMEKADRLAPIFMKEKGIVLSRRVKQNTVKGIRTLYNSAGPLNSSRYW